MKIVDNAVRHHYCVKTMGGCYLSVSGKSFDVAGYLDRHDFDPVHSWRRGEPTKLRRKLKCKDSGFKVEVSATFGALAPQVRDAIRFLKKYRRRIQRLTAWPGVEDVRLDFAVHRQVGCVINSFYLSPELAALAGQLGVGIEFTVYPDK